MDKADKLLFMLSFFLATRSSNFPIFNFKTL